MDLKLNTDLVKGYKSESQKIRIMSEAWTFENAYCPSSGSKLTEYAKNKPVGDFYCESDKEDFELKAKGNRFGKKIVDGAYSTMITRLLESNNPNLFLLSYNPERYTVKNFYLIPKHFFVPKVIEKRPPLSDSAQRAGWIGCNILLNEIPRSGFIFYVRNGKESPKSEVLTLWKNTLFLREEKNSELKGWLLEVMKCIDKLNKKQFTLSELYSFEDYLSQMYPDNRHIKAKIRQQLQILRDRGYLEFIEPGVYGVK